MSTYTAQHRERLGSVHDMWMTRPGAVRPFATIAFGRGCDGLTNLAADLARTDLGGNVVVDTDQITPEKAAPTCGGMT